MSENIICFSSAPFEKVGCDKKQAFRFLGCAGYDGKDELDCVYEKSLAFLCEAAFFKAVWRKTSLSFPEKDTVEFDFGKIRSAALCKNLNGCRYAYVFAATAGNGVDRLLLRYGHISKAQEMVISAAASSAVECWCDIINDKITEDKKSRPRFSPGYGGVELCHQREILDFLDAGRKVGITLTDTFFMTPVKSVTAIIGMEE